MYPPPTTIQDRPSGVAITVFVLGVSSIVCGMGCVTGAVAWILGHAEMQKIDAGQAPQAGRTFANVGRILGIIGTFMTTITTIVSVVAAFLMFGQQ